MREASTFLCEQRDLIEALDPTRVIQAPSCTNGKHDSEVDGPRADATNHESTNRSYLDDVNEEDDEADYDELCGKFDDDTNKPVFDEEFTRSYMRDLHKYTPSSGEPTSDLVSTKEVGSKMKRKFKSAMSLVPMTNDPSDDVDRDRKRRKLEKEVPGSSMEEPDEYDIEMEKAMNEMLSNDLHERQQCTSKVVSKPVDTEEISKQTKRKRESTDPLEPPTEDLSDHVDRDLKRRKLDVAVGAVEPPQVGSSNATGLDSIDLELLGEGEEGNESEQKHERSSVNEDLKLVSGIVLYPLASHADLQIAKAAASLIDIRRSNTNVTVLEPANREAVPKALGASN